MNRRHTEQVDDTPRIVRNEPALWLSKLPTVDSSSNKYTLGHALIFGGYPMTGAAKLAARACARMGAGLTTIAVNHAHSTCMRNSSKASWCGQSPMTKTFE